MGSLGGLLLQVVFILKSVKLDFPPGFCPHVRVKCHFREMGSCAKHKDCKFEEKCCQFSCAKNCINPTYDPCEHPVSPVSCSSTRTRWYYSVQDNDCFPFNFSDCIESKNNFQSREVCKQTWDGKRLPRKDGLLPGRYR
uniref:BPTI/Kunitz inhibitor domain-containing protein n=1 Tax=Monodelphis domestica TaxID=13616 RepID=A0A5F8GC46_MONDO